MLLQKISRVGIWFNFRWTSDRYNEVVLHNHLWTKIHIRGGAKTSQYVIYNSTNSSWMCVPFIL